MKDVYIIDAVRTPRGKGKKRGALAHIHPVDLASYCIKGIVERNPVDPEAIDDVILGCVTQVGEQGACIARNAVLASGLPIHVPGYTLNRFCGSGLQAVQNASAMIGSGMMDLVIAGGVESMSRVKMGQDIEGYDLYVGNETLKNRFHLVPQGISADLIATIYHITREEADRFAEESQKRAHHAIQNGYFKKSILPVPAVNGGFVEYDEHPRIENTFEFLSSLPLAFKTFGEKEFDAIALKAYPQVEKIHHIHTLGNSSGVVDGAGVVLLASEEAVKTFQLKPRARIVANAVVGTEPTIMLTGPVPASRKVLKKANLKIEDIDLWEINEAFAAVVIYIMRELQIPHEIVNVNGGAIALGHPLGATGAILLGTLLDELERRNKRYGLVTLCIGGGMGIATIIEKL
ncbi:MAG: acetyl-CoA C-acetyltransferase [Leptospiraceae bacterium]|nr:acetyl-CoA C-acetyltransferase [Leptospiraceae bacterium]MDW7974992.1 acetyl-CoA C-acetyltransferase [Leptospiraceae bacterium]